jgi:hypothetical protein
LTSRNEATKDHSPTNFERSARGTQRGKSARRAPQWPYNVPSNLTGDRMSSLEPHGSPHAGHGSTPAAWTAVTIMLIGAALGTIAMGFLNWPLFWVSVGIIVVGGIVGKVLQMMGFGATPVHHRPPVDSTRGAEQPTREE